VAINCGTIQPELLESELFGHTRGAFTGAHQARDGLFLHANNGTLFLDEIGEMPLSMQSKLLRVLEERLVRPVGAEREVPINVRVIAATNRNLQAQTEAGDFRKDLYYRLNVMPISVPALRDRVSDIPLLVDYFFDALCAELRLPSVELRHSDLARMQSYSWPGNVRELKNVIERTLLMGRLPTDCLGEADNEHEIKSANGYPLDWSVEEVERAHMEAVLELCNNNKSEAARRLGVSRKTLERKQNQWRQMTSASDSDTANRSMATTNKNAETSRSSAKTIQSIESA